MSKSVAQAQAALDAANAEYLDEIGRDCERRDGSGAQEDRRERRQQSLLSAISQCERDLEAAKSNQTKTTGAA